MVLSHSNAIVMPSDASADAIHIGWIGEGDSFGEVAMVNPLKPRPVTVTAGEGGVVLMGLGRAAYARLQAQSQAHPVSGMGPSAICQSSLYFPEG
jgi:CRP-like cAMP-binding protein